jgi:hypothetical protein
MLVRSCVVLALASPALAGQVTYFASTVHAPGSMTLTVPQFDPVLGHLREVSSSGSGRLVGFIDYENLGAACVGINGHPYVAGYMSIPGVPAGGILSPWDYGTTFNPAVLAPFDGLLDYAGPSGWRADFDVGQAWGGSYSGTAQPIYAPIASPVIGTGWLTVDAQLNAITWAYGSCDSQLPNLSINDQANVAASFVITYYYDDYPARYCFGHEAGLACPCGEPWWGLTGGCESSTSLDGANLVPSGSSRVLADDFVLEANGLPLHASVLFFQGTQEASPVPFGDGVRCVGGFLIRLGVKQAIVTTAHYPDPGDPTISVKGTVPVGAFRTYQAWYRNAAPFCTSSTFNLTSAVATVWTP